MEPTTPIQPILPDQNTPKFWQSRSFTRVAAAIVLLIVAIVTLVDQSYIPFPEWVFTWKMLLIAIGVFRLIERQTADLLGMILIMVGGYFLARQIDPTYVTNIELWPFILIAIALYLLFGRRPSSKVSGRYQQRKVRREGRRDARQDNDAGFGGQPNMSSNFGGNQAANQPYTSTVPPSSNNPFVTTTDEIVGERLNMNLLFAANKKRVIAPIFKGGQINCLMGGAELDLYETNIEGKVYLDVNVIMGGLELRLPSSWQIDSDQTAILGGIDDTRKQVPKAEGPTKILVLTGFVIMGGIEITN